MYIMHTIGKVYWTLLYFPVRLSTSYSIELVCTQVEIYESPGNQLFPFGYFKEDPLQTRIHSIIELRFENYNSHSTYIQWQAFSSVLSQPNQTD